uniref:Uncharacterized protein n=1 Tax=Anguilla anguilla TaxID=7936 RepID=A0A0E9SWN0_ANGAN
MNHALNRIFFTVLLF